MVVSRIPSAAAVNAGTILGGILPFLLIILLVLAVVAAVAGIIIFLLVKGGKGKPVQPPAAQQPPAPQPDSPAPGNGPEA